MGFESTPHKGCRRFDVLGELAGGPLSRHENGSKSNVFKQEFDIKFAVFFFVVLVLQLHLQL